LEIFLEPQLPAPLLVVVGDSPIAAALLALAAPLGYTALAAAGGELPGDAAALVIASHGRDHEEERLAEAVRAGIPYVGLVASRKRGETVLAGLPVCESMKSRIHTPAGLDIGARTPEEVALSILAEIVSLRPRPSGRPVAADDRPAFGVAIDPVCGMSVSMVDASLHLDHDGERHWFCGSGCLRAFAASPSNYVAGDS
jgi:xanthine dehydrogenase accessory factor